MNLGELVDIISDPYLQVRVVSELDQKPELRGKVLYSGEIQNIFHDNSIIFDDVYLDELYVDYIDVGDEFTIYVC